VKLEVRILNELRARFSEVRILKSLAFLLLGGRCFPGCPEVGREGLTNKVRDHCQQTRERIAWMYSFIKYYARNGRKSGANGDMQDSSVCGGNEEGQIQDQVQKPNWAPSVWVYFRETRKAERG
jgi:hypothetical protein